MHRWIQVLFENCTENCTSAALSTFAKASGRPQAVLLRPSAGWHGKMLAHHVRHCVAQVVVDFIPAGADAAGLAAEGVQLLSQAPACSGNRAAPFGAGGPLTGGAVADLSACLGTSRDGRLALRGLPEGGHTLYLPRARQVQLIQSLSRAIASICINKTCSFAKQCLLNTYQYFFLIATCWLHALLGATCRSMSRTLCICCPRPEVCNSSDLDHVLLHEQGPSVGSVETLAGHSTMNAPLLKLL